MEGLKSTNVWRERTMLLKLTLRKNTRWIGDFFIKIYNRSTYVISLLRLESYQLCVILPLIQCTIYLIQLPCLFPLPPSFLPSLLPSLPICTSQTLTHTHTHTHAHTHDHTHTLTHIHSLGATTSPSLKLATLDWALKSGDVKLQDIFSPIGTVSGSPEGCSMAWTYFQDVRYTNIDSNCNSAVLYCVIL